MKKCLFFTLLFLFACSYTTPPRSEWSAILKGTSNEAMSSMLRVAKKPLYEESGGIVIAKDSKSKYMSDLELQMEENLRKPGIQITRVGTDIRIVIVRSAIIYTDSPEVSEMGDDLLSDLADVLRQFDATWIEITGYTDAINNQKNAITLSRDMALKVAVYLAKHGINPLRMFVNGRGSANPIADQSDIGRLTNLRVEIRLSIV